MAGPIATLRVLLTGDDAELRKSLNRSDKKLSAFEKREIARQKRIKAARKAAATAVTRGAALTVAALATATKAAISHADGMAKTAKEIGMTVSQYDAMQSAADLAGVSQEKFNMSLRTFNRLAGEAAMGTGEGVKMYDRLGISLRNTDGSLKDNRTLLGEVANRMEGVTDHTERAAIANKLFGESGARMLEMMKGGDAALIAQEERMRSLGAVMSDEVAKKAEQLQDKFSLMADVVKTSLTTSLVNLAELVLPAVVKGLDYLQMAWHAAVIAGSGALALVVDFGGAMGAMVGALGSAARHIGDYFGNLFNNIPLKAKLGMLKMQKTIIDGFAKIEQMVASSETIRKFFGLEEPGSGYFSGVQSELQTGIDAAAAALADAPQYEEMGENFMEKFGYGVESKAGEIFDRLDAEIADRMAKISSISADGGTASLVSDSVDGQSSGAPDGVDAAANAADAQVQLSADMNAKIDTMNRNTAKQAIGYLQQQVKGGSVAAKALMAAMTAMNIAQILSNTEVAKVRALAELGPVAGPPMAAAIQAQGMVSVGIAAAQGVSGMFHDGIDNVPNTGTYLLEKGERVVDRRLNEDLTKALSEGNGGVGQTISPTFNFSGDISPDRMRELMLESKDSLQAVLSDINSDRAGQGLI